MYFERFVYAANTVFILAFNAGIHQTCLVYHSAA